MEEEIDRKKILPEGQVGFRKKRATTDNTYILNHVTQKAIAEGRKIYIIFVDLKAAFDTVNRDKLWTVIEEAEISRYLTERIKELYEETRSCLRTKESYSEDFWTTKGVRQGCLLSPALFCIYIAGLEAELEKRFIGGIKIRKKRVWTLAYADDIVLLVDGREALTDMIETIRSFLKGRYLILSAEKTKIMVFGKKGREKAERWIWDGKEMDEVKSSSTYDSHSIEKDGMG